ncbi:KN motif and ankyrin repeat domain-containing protein 3 isoform X2 [Cimex lectularius]|uniref:KN motif and ankyrin repeat domain-containing protein 1 n=1 Tax=Cimex lectularius TaxID=79782 RepID=A0A8I6SAN8_CIMLE|nr:KN motif and ankyrin repeat domain-containing protein 3 isoform X2 [Cimex lectularius]
MAAVLETNHKSERQSGKMSGRRRCCCCPYGYHIDLDFVRYCESITNSQLMPDTSRKRISNIKRKRASREALLGLTDYSNVQHEKITTRGSQDVEDDLERAVIDFEKTLLNTSLPRGTHVYNSKDWPKYENSHYNGGSLDRYNLKRNKFSVPSSYCQLENEGKAKIISKNEAEVTTHSDVNNTIRKQMATSLKRMRELEDEIKLIPGLKEEIQKLQQENSKLHDSLKSSNEMPKKREIKTKSDVATSTYDICHTRTVGVGCTVLTREVGVAMMTPAMISTGTDPLPTGERTKELLNQEHGDTISLNKIIGTPPSFKFKNAATSTELKLDDIFTEDDVNEKLNFKRAIIKLKMKNAETLTEILVNDIYTKADLDKEVKLNIDAKKAHLKNVQTSTQTIQLKNVQTSTISNLKHVQTSTNLNRHQVFTQEDIDEEIKKNTQLYEKNVLNNALTKKLLMTSVGVQAVEITKVLDKCNASSQTAQKCQDVAISAVPRVYDNTCQASCQTRDVGVSDDTVKQKECQKCNVQRFTISTNFPELGTMQDNLLSEPFDFNRILKVRSESLGTDTEDLILARDVGVNTMKMKSVSTALDTCDLPCRNCAKQQENQVKPVQQNTPKRPSYLPISIQRHNSKPTSPSPSRNLPTPTKPLHGRTLSVVGSTSEVQLKNSTLDRLKNDDTNSGSGSDDGTYTFLHDSSSVSSKLESLLTQSPKPRNYKKIEPSKEMRGAMKVLNDALQHSPFEDFPKHMKTAVNIIQQEWFKISSVTTSNPLHVEDYLDCFEEISSTLLEYIVNMTDVTGNTAMHYAVSNGNFDVVSILLDSKVCNINKLNTAGYTCIMLVALTKVKSETDREVVRRLFHMADVNIRAKEHGQTALMLAVSHGRIDTVEMLLEAGADVNIQDEDGSTALMCAAEHGCIDIVKLLLAQPDCDLSITDYDGSTALAIAMNAGNRDIGVLLYAQEHFSRGNSPYTSLKTKRSKSTTPTLKPSRPATPSHSSHKKDFDAVDPS